MPQHIVVDGSNIATEGRAMPSLKQLNEAVMAFIEERPDALITVVVDATFGHRIAPKELAEFDEAVANNELVAPPAGAIGRGDAFLLSIANKVKADILSNDSFQEFHGQYTWLFDEGRLIGGKPVPHIGWVFVLRSPVRGPLSRKSVSEAKRRGGRSDRAGQGERTGQGEARIGSPEANQPMPIPKAPPPGPAAKKAKTQAGPAPKRGGGAAPVPAPVLKAAPEQPKAAATTKAAGVNDLLTFLGFVELHPPGTSVNAVVEHYSSHGAYVRIGEEVKGYVPLRLMADPAPRSAREFMKVGDSVTLVVDSFVASRRSIDLAVPEMAVRTLPVAAPAKRTRKKASAPAAPAEAPPASVQPPAPAESAPPTKKPRRAAKAAAAAPPLPEVVAPAEPAPRPRRSKSSAAAPTLPTQVVAPTPLEATPGAPTRAPRKKAARPAATTASVESQPAAKPVRRRAAKKV